MFHPYLDLWQIEKCYPTPDRRGVAIIVRDFNLRMEQGEFVTLLGHSGCGKSTVLSMVAGLTEITSGAIILGGKEIDGPGPDRGVVFQSHCLLPWMTAAANVQLGVDQVYGDKPESERRAIAEYYLDLVGLGDCCDKLPAEISLGMRQRVGLARAFALNPKMFLLDEPFGMLDMLTRIELQDALIELWDRDQKTALMVTHDVDESLFLSDRIVLMTNGPSATVGKIITVPFPRPRHRAEVLEHPDYYSLREEIITFLEEQGHPTEPSAAAHATVTSMESEAEEQESSQTDSAERIGNSEPHELAASQS